MTNYKIPFLPLPVELETRRVLKKTASARSALAELKGAASGIPNESILISTLSLQEAKDSSAIEDTITPHDELDMLRIRGMLFQSQKKGLVQLLLAGKRRLKVK